jgi:hypothetical protein
MTIHRLILLGGALFGVVIQEVVTDRSFSLFVAIRHNDSWQVQWEIWWMIAGALAGALTGHFLWVLVDPRRRLSRAATVLILLNTIIWISYLIVTPPLAMSEFEQIEAERTLRDAGTGGLDFVTHAPTVVAGRWHGTFGAVNVADSWLTLFAFPATITHSCLSCPLFRNGLQILANAIALACRSCVGRRSGVNNRLRRYAAAAAATR